MQNNLAKNLVYKKRAELLYAWMQEVELEALILEDPVSLFYWTGMRLSQGIFLVYKGKSLLFVDGRYWAICKKEAFVEVEKMEEKKENGFLSSAKSIGFDAQTLSWSRWERWNKAGLSSLQPAPASFYRLRSIKDPLEIEQLQKAADHVWQLYKELTLQLKEGISEIELAIYFEKRALEKFQTHPSFSPIVAFGENSAFPHHKPGERLLKKGDLVLLDLGVFHEHYCSDMTRIISFGSIPPDLEKIVQVVKKAHKAAVDLCKPGIYLHELDTAARQAMQREGLEELFTHSLGHGVGLEIHEYPSIRSLGPHRDDKLTPGMVITIEPGLYKSGVGGARFEDMLLITEKGAHNFYPQEENEV